MTREEHIEIHKELHDNLDDLLADFMRSHKGPVLDLTIRELMSWSFGQTTNPDKEEK